MKKRLARLFTKWAIKLNPEAATEAVVPIYEHYEARAIGVGHELTKNDLRKFKQANSEKSSKKAMRQLIDHTIKRQAGMILDTAKGIIEVSTYKRGESVIVESRLNVYVKAESEPAESAEGSGAEESRQ